MLSTLPEHLSPSLEVRENRELASEIKFLIPTVLGGEIRAWARERLVPDPYAGGEMGDTYRTTSLYFDTAGFDVLHKNGSFGRSKYRIRRYGESEGVFLERKLKNRDMVSKRRSIIRADDLKRLRDSVPQHGWAGHWFHRRVHARSLRPVCQISYFRTARVGTAGFGAIRLTLDQDIRAVSLSRLAFSDGAATPLADRHTILELKFRHSLPVMFRELIETFRLQPQAVSKYRLASATEGCINGWIARAQSAECLRAVEPA